MTDKSIRALCTMAALCCLAGRDDMAYGYILELTAWCAFSPGAASRPDA